MLDRVRDEVAEAYARTHARFAQIVEEEEAVRASIRGFREDLDRARQDVGLPIEVLNNLQLKLDSQLGYLAAIVDYNRAQFELYVALGQPPAAFLARPVPTEGITPTMPEGAIAPNANGGNAPTAVAPTAPPAPPFSPPLPSPSRR